MVAEPAGDEGIAGELPAFGDDRARRRRATLAEIPILVGIAVLIAFTFRVFVAQAFFIPSASMTPQLNVGDRVVVSKFSYRAHDPNRGDVIVFDCPPRAVCPQRDDGGVLPIRVIRGLLEAVGLRPPSTEEYIKRVVGLPGDVVQGKDGRVLVNGRLLIEPYLPDGVTTSDFGPFTVPAGQLWVMGDNRSNSSDSRVFGTITESSVVGRAILRVWPPGRIAYL